MNTYNGYTESQHNIDARAQRRAEAEQEYLAAQIVADVTSVTAVTEAEAKDLQTWLDFVREEPQEYDITVEQLTAAYMQADPRTAEQRDIEQWQAEAEDVGFGRNGRPL